MFWNIYKNRIRVSLRDKDNLIWTWIFPLMMATLFFFVFTEIDNAGRFSAVPTAVVDNAAFQADTALSEAVRLVAAGEERLLDVTYVGTVEEADSLLEEGEVAGYIMLENEKPVLRVKESGLSQTILKSFLDQYQQTAALYRTGAANPQALQQLGEWQAGQAYTQAVSLSGTKPSETVTYFYALLAMVCLYGGFQGMTSVIYLQANLSPLGARRSVSPIGKLRMVCYDLLGGLTVHVICVLVVMTYLVFVLRVNFVGQLVPVLLVCLVGSLTGVAMGAMITSVSRLRETVKTAILVSVTLVLCFMAGLMVSGINYVIEQALPLLAWLNPAARIADAFYCLYYYDTYTRFVLDICVLIGMTVVMFGISIFALRRRTYESI